MILSLLWFFTIKPHYIFRWALAFHHEYTRSYNFAHFRSRPTTILFRVMAKSPLHDAHFSFLQKRKKKEKSLLNRFCLIIHFILLSLPQMLWVIPLGLNHMTYDSFVFSFKSFAYNVPKVHTTSGSTFQVSHI